MATLTQPVLSSETGASSMMKNSVSGNEVSLHKGLVNRPGDNHCFLNCVIQILWNLSVFREKFMFRAQQLPQQAGNRSENVMAALASIFAELADQNSNKLVECELLRLALSSGQEGGKRFQLNQMDDAVECYEEVLLSLHESEQNGMSSPTSPSSSTLPSKTALSSKSVCSPACLVHEVMAMSVQEQSICGCGAQSAPQRFDKFIQYVPASLILRKDLQDAVILNHKQLELITGLSLATSSSNSDTNTATNAANNTQTDYTLPSSFNGNIVDFGRLLGLVLQNDLRKCPGPTPCNDICTAGQPLLINSPSVFSIGVAWPTFQTSVQDLDTFLLAMAPVINLGDVFTTSKGSTTKTLGQSPSSSNFDFRRDTMTKGQVRRSLLMQGMIAYYGLHYVAFFYNNTEKTWMMFDDTQVKLVGPHWSDLVNKCMKGRYQPSVLFYETCSSSTAKSEFRQFISRRLTHEGELVRDPATLMIPNDAENVEENYLTPQQSNAFASFEAKNDQTNADEKMARELQHQFEEEARLDEQNSRRFKVNGTNRNMTRDEAMLALQVLQRQLEKSINYLQSRVQVRIGMMGMFIKAKVDRIVVLHKVTLALYNPMKEINLTHPRHVLPINANCSLDDKQNQTLRKSEILYIRIKSGTTTFEITFGSDKERQIWHQTLSAIIKPDDQIELLDVDESLIGLFELDATNNKTAPAPPPPALNQCVCGRPVDCVCSRCHLQAYCSVQCQQLHWRIHMNFCTQPLDSIAQQQQQQQQQQPLQVANST